MNADDLSRISMSASLATTVARAVEYARAQGHLDVTLEHMLMALCEDPDAGLVLAASNVDVTRLRTDVSSYLGGLDRRAPPGQSADPVVSADLQRILEAAAAAARGGRRREINGAIVLAAIVGDGKSPAAHLLRAQGLTFEGAIRALQKGPAADRQSGSAAPGRASADDILASARERVQSRALPGMRKPEFEPTARDEPAEDYDQIAEEEAYQPAAGDEAAASDFGPAEAEEPVYEEEAYAPPSEEEPPPTPASAPYPPPLPVPEDAGKWTPPRSADNAMLARPTPVAPPPLPPLPPVRTGAAEPRPPPAPWPDVLPGPPGVGSGGARRPRVEGVGAAADPRPSLAERSRAFDNRYERALTGSQAASRPLTAPQSARPAGARMRAEVGQLVENIPRTMRVAVPVLIEVRVARANVQNLAEGLQGGGAAYQHEVTITKAMTVCLRAPDGGFFIESASPETQWIERVLTLSADDYASWRWHVTPRERGRRRLQLVISARTVGADGVAAETALPDQVITVRVRTNYGKSFARWTGWVVAAVIGGLLAKFGEGGFDPVLRMISDLIPK